MTEVEQIIDRLSQLDETLNVLKEKKKEVDDEIKEKEQELIDYCENHGKDIELITNGKYNLKPISGRKLKKVKN
jgi:hypothetical protein